MIEILGLSLLLAALSSETGTVMSLAVMGDRAEELGYPRPPGLTPAWGVPVETPDGGVEWVAWDLDTIDPYTVPEHLTWMKPWRWERLVRSWALDVVAEVLPTWDRLAEKHFSESDMPGALEDAVETVRAHIAMKATDSELEDAAEHAWRTMYRVVEFMDNNPWRSVEERLDVKTMKHIGTGVYRLCLLNVSWQMPAVAAALKSIREAKATGAIVHPELEGHYDHGAHEAAHDEQYRQLAERIDAVAPWALSANLR